MGKTKPVGQSNQIDKYTVAMGREDGATGGSQHSDAEDGGPDPSLKDIMKEIKTFRGTLEPKLDSVTEEVNLLRADFRKMSEKISTAEAGLGTLEAKTKRLEEQVLTLTKQQAEVHARLKDQEGRARRNNLRITGVPEGMEGPSMDLFVEDLVLKHLKPKRLSKFFTVERAHRALGGKPKPGAPPRTIIAQILNYRDRDAILQAARTHGDLHIDNAIIRFFPDFTLHVQRQRRFFDEVKKALRETGIKYMMLFPAKLSHRWSENVLL